MIRDAIGIRLAPANLTERQAIEIAQAARALGDFAEVWHEWQDTIDRIVGSRSAERAYRLETEARRRRILAERRARS